MDATATLKTVELGLNLLAQRPPTGAFYGIHHARTIVAKADAGEDLGDMDQRNLGTFRETVKRYDAWQRRQEYARALLGDFSLSSEFTDHKDRWEDDQ